MADFAEKTQYKEDVAEHYNTTYTTLPQSQLEIELTVAALGECSNKLVLDLGGGTGLNARQALDAGAARADLVDISPAMVEEGKKADEEAGSDGKIRWV
jgi:ubiquinone/menaquinone biosynthesis C-methylase UbiE